MVNWEVTEEKDFCPSCGTELNENKVCPSCGRDLGPALAEQKKRDREQERREFTLLGFFLGFVFSLIGFICLVTGTMVLGGFCVVVGVILFILSFFTFTSRR